MGKGEVNIKILVATHKKYDMPISDIYMPIQTGKDGSPDLGYQGDNKGDNISKKNSLYCELTTLYWGWKNLNCDYIGLVHYRRYFSLKFIPKSYDDILTQKEIKILLNKNDVLVAKHKTYLQSISNHYIHCIKSRVKANKTQLEALRKIIAKEHFEYLDTYDIVMNGRKAHMLNMFIMSKQDADNYCEWLFDILFKLEKELIVKNVIFDRIMGAFSEFLLDVWLIYNKKNIRELKLYETERNFFKKLVWALKRKFKE